MMADCEDFVTHIPGVQGGAPILRGTRTPVGTVVAYLRNDGGDLSDVQSALPHLTREQIDAALAYYHRHRDEVDADERRHERALEQFRQAV